MASFEVAFVHLYIATIVVGKRKIGFECDGFRKIGNCAIKVAFV